jgi:hypothetical protein
MISYGSKVWFRLDPDSEWLRGSVTAVVDAPTSRLDKTPKSRISLEIQNEAGDEIGETAEVVSGLVEGSFEEFESVKLRNNIDDDTEAADGVEDLITLNHLHEPAILTCLRKRFDRNLIYTNTGPILIATVFNWSLIGALIF